MGILSKIFHRNELELHDETPVEDDFKEQETDEKKSDSNIEKSPFLMDDENNKE